MPALGLFYHAMRRFVNKSAAPFIALAERTKKRLSFIRMFLTFREGAGKIDSV